MKLIYLFWDQLSLEMSSLKDIKNSDDSLIFLAETFRDCSYVKHHKKKLVLILSAMRHFRDLLESKGFKVQYLNLDETRNQTHGDILKALFKEHNPSEIVLTQPSDFYQMQDVEDFREEGVCDLRILEDDRFFASRDEFCEWAKSQKSPTMEYFYRKMRKKTGYLMKGDDPEGGKWNFDKDNRSPPKKGMDIDPPRRFYCDELTNQVIKDVNDNFSDHLGSTDGFRYAVTRSEAQAALSYFVDEALVNFGTYQDAMIKGEPFMYHSILSPYIHLGLLLPAEVCERVIQAYYDQEGDDVPLSAVEGFVRQILGWREYVRGIYWLKMPDYKELNQLEAKRPLPQFYWTGETDMACMREAISATIDNAYAHHIQRLMITGNFALIAGLDVKEVCEWYHIVYMDAHEWVELPNTLGMSLFGDGGYLGSKPYAASANYINKMSNYCADCRYDPKKKVGDDACPFNALYWNFFLENATKLKSNHRLGITYRNLERQDPEEQKQIKSRAETILNNL